MYIFINQSNLSVYFDMILVIDCIFLVPKVHQMSEKIGFVKNFRDWK